MRIQRMYLNGFGIHRDRTFDLDMDAQATVFYGRNEAGKSTLMGFVRSMLFGFPRRSNKLERYEPLSGGVHGGALTIMDGIGREIRLERYEKNDSLKLLFSDGTVAGEAALQSLLGGLTAELYRNLFAFSLSELQRLDTLHAEEISGFLLSAGMGISGGMMVQAERSITQQMDVLYKRHGTKQAINEQLRIIEQGELELRRSKEKSGKYQDWQIELARWDEVIALDENELSLKRIEGDWLNKCLQSRDSWIEWLEIDNELHDLPEFTNFPEDAIGRFERIQEEVDRTNLELLTIQQEYENARRQLSELIVNEKLVAYRDELEQLLEAAAIYSDSTVRIADSLTDIEGYRAQLHRYLRQISMDWTEEQLQQFPLSVHHREQVSVFAEQFNSYYNRRQARLNESERLEGQVEQSQLLKNNLQHKHDDMSQRMKVKFHRLFTMKHDQLNSYESEVHKLWDHTRKLASDLTHMEERLADASRNEHLLHAKGRSGTEHLRSSKAKPRPRNDMIKYLSLVINIVLPSWIVIGLNNMVTGISMFMILSFFNIYLWLQNKKTTAPPEHEESLLRETLAHRERLEKEINLLRLQWVKLCEQLYSMLSNYAEQSEAAAARSWSELGKHTDVYESIRQLEPWVEAFIYDIGLYKKAGLELRDIEKMLERAIQDQDEIAKRLSAMLENDSKHQREEAQLKMEWGQWLEQYQLPVDLSVESMKTMFQYAESGLQIVDQITRTNNKLAAYQEAQRSFVRSATIFLDQLGVESPLSASEIVYELKKLKELLEHQFSIQEKRRLMVQQVKELENREQQCTERITNSRDKLNSLLLAANAMDEDELRKWDRLRKRRLDLEQSKRHLQVVIFTWVREEHHDKLFQTLEQLDADQLHHQLSTVNEVIIQLELRLNESKDRRGGLRKEMDNLQSGGQHAELLQRHQENIAEFQQLASRWAELAISAELMRRAKEIYERERQPDVLLKASQYMRTITDGQFIRVVSRLGEKSIFIERENGEQLDSAFLSRGTAEQLYLAMRFALADE